MRILFISNDLIAGHLAQLLRNEGHDVLLYISEKKRRNNFKNLVSKTNNWKKSLSWVGKEGLIIFDDIGFGEEQDTLRAQGYRVFGGSKLGDKLEIDRAYAQDIFEKSGIQKIPTVNFDTIDAAINYAKLNKNAWVIKQNGSSSKSLNFVGHFPDSRDIIDVLERYKILGLGKKEIITLQKRVYGIEIAITRYFNGTHWVGPSLINIEHKRFFPGDIGPTTSEMGTLGWYDYDENNKLHQATLKKLESHLKEINYRGCIDINCIVDEDKVYPLEVTARIGSPIIHLQSELNITPWSDLISAIADGKDFDVKVKDGFGIVVVVALPPFPYSKYIKEQSSIGSRVYFEEFSEDDFKHIHFEEIAWNKKEKVHYISDNRGYVLYVTGQSTTVPEVQEKTYDLIKRIHIPKMFYRNDIGLRFNNEQKALLQKWGYLKII
ncbi:MAG: hypothetical protein HZA80_02980 [Candidatus Taylorbacteria bacterium]|nr:hypothetical protein [Candidatus Taylorbacteria bacterium]